jgi:hypothetical protein
MPVSPQLQLDSELADLDQQLRAVDSRRDLSDGQKVILRATLQRNRQQKNLELQILGQVRIVESRERDVEAARKRSEWAQTPDGLKALVRREMLRLAGAALGGGSGRNYSPLDMLEPEERVIRRVKGDLARAEEAQRKAQATLFDLQRELLGLKVHRADWDAQQPEQLAAAEPLKPIDSRGATQAIVAEHATWADIEITFLSDERVQIRNGTAIETRNYAEFGFADRRNDIPNRAWTVLRILAEQRGILPSGGTTGPGWEKNERRVQEIRKLFRQHFGIPADPIPYVHGTGYQARFKIRCGPSYET